MSESPESQRLCDFAWLRATNGGEAQGYPPIVRRLLAAHDDAATRLAEATALLERIVKYAREDRATTPGVTRLARALAEAERLPSQPQRRPGREAVSDCKFVDGDNIESRSLDPWCLETLEASRAETAAATARIAELESLFQATHGVHWSWVAKVTESETALRELLERVEKREEVLWKLWKDGVEMPADLCAEIEKGARGQ